GHQMSGMPAGRDMPNSLGMLQLGRGESPLRELGPSLGRGMGEQTSDERAVRNGPPAGNGMQEANRVPGFPQDMMDMHGMYSAADMKKIDKPETRGMRRSWFDGVEGLMTVLRVLPADLYDKVMSGKGEI